MLSQGGGTPGEIDAEQAKQLAMAMWRDGYGLMRHIIERDRGTPIHAEELVVCERAYYVESAYTATPQIDDLAILKSIAPRWLVGLCYGEVQEVVVSVSAFATDAELTANGRRLSRAGEGNFHTLGVPLGSVIPPAPENAVIAVAEATNRRISVVPRLVMRPRPFSAMVAVWHLDLETPVVIRGQESRRSQSVKHIVFGHLNGWHMPVMAHVLDGSGSTEFRSYTKVRTGQKRDVVLQRKAEVARRLELIQVEGR